MPGRTGAASAGATGRSRRWWTGARTRAAAPANWARTDDTPGRRCYHPPHGHPARPDRDPGARAPVARSQDAAAARARVRPGRQGGAQGDRRHQGPTTRPPTRPSPAPSPRPAAAGRGSAQPARPPRASPPRRASGGVRGPRSARPIRGASTSDRRGRPAPARLQPTSPSRIHVALTDDLARLADGRRRERRRPQRHPGDQRQADRARDVVRRRPTSPRPPRSRAPCRRRPEDGVEPLLRRVARVHDHHPPPAHEPRVDDRARDPAAPSRAGPARARRPPGSRPGPARRPHGREAAPDLLRVPRRPQLPERALVGGHRSMAPAA